jgi:hypothetical protein
MKDLSIEGVAEHVPNVEVERKYLLNSESDAGKLEERVKQFPGSHLVGAWSETSYYFPIITKEKAQQLLALVMRYRGDGGIDVLAKLDSVPEDTPIQMRLRERKNPISGGSFLLTFKASANPLHDVERIEIDTDDISQRYLEGFSANGVDPKSIWHSMRREYAIDEHTKIDVQNVTGYGWTAEVESNDLSRVDEIATALGIQPLSKVSLDAMYKQYGKEWQKYYTGEGEGRHFSPDDWKEIESVSGEGVTRNSIN